MSSAVAHMAIAGRNRATSDGSFPNAGSARCGGCNRTRAGARHDARSAVGNAPNAGSARCGDCSRTPLPLGPAGSAHPVLRRQLHQSRARQKKRTRSERRSPGKQRSRAYVTPSSPPDEEGKRCRIHAQLRSRGILVSTASKVIASEPRSSMSLRPAVLLLRFSNPLPQPRIPGLWIGTELADGDICAQSYKPE
jgi:hypothetical protein